MELRRRDGFASLGCYVIVFLVKEVRNEEKCLDLERVKVGVLRKHCLVK